MRKPRFFPGLQSNRRFWDEKAKENALWYVSSYGEYGHEEEAGFWQSGKSIWEQLKSETSYSPAKSDVVVEIGCGVGRLTRAIACEVAYVYAQDISSEMLSVAKNHRLENVSFLPSNGQSLDPIPDSIADLVFAYSVFQHLPSVDVLSVYLKEMARVGKEGALIIFTLEPRSWRTHLLPLLRTRRFLLESITKSGPSGLYRHEWVGIRPSLNCVMKLSPISLEKKMLHGNKWLLYGRTHAGPEAR